MISAGIGLTVVGVVLLFVWAFVVDSRLKKDTEYYFSSNVFIFCIGVVAVGLCLLMIGGLKSSNEAVKQKANTAIATLSECQKEYRAVNNVFANNKADLISSCPAAKEYFISEYYETEMLVSSNKKEAVLSVTYFDSNTSANDSVTLAAS